MDDEFAQDLFEALARWTDRQRARRLTVPALPIPDGPFGGRGFAWAGRPRDFGRAALQHRLAVLLWHRGPVPCDEIATYVWGDDHDPSEDAMRVLAYELSERFRFWRIPLRVRSAGPGLYELFHTEGQ